MRIDEKTKRSAKRVLDRLGITMGTAIKAYLKQIELQECIPMKIVTENGLTPQEEREVIKAAREARRGKNVSRWFTSVDEMFKELDA